MMVDNHNNNNGEDNNQEKEDSDQDQDETNVMPWKMTGRQQLGGPHGHTHHHHHSSTPNPCCEQLLMGWKWGATGRGHGLAFKQ
jgi:hypothetical protein